MTDFCLISFLMFMVNLLSKRFLSSQYELFDEVSYSPKFGLKSEKHLKYDFQKVSSKLIKVRS